MNQRSADRNDVLRAAASKARSGLSDKLGDIWGALMWKAAFIGIFGVCALVWPTASFNLLVVAVAVLLILDGIVGLFSTLRAGEHEAFLGQSILSLVVGGILLFWPDVTTRILLRVIGVWALLHGALLIWSLRALEGGSSYRDTQRTVGIILAIVGAVMLFWPNVGVVTFSWVLGIAALVIAAVLIWLARRMKALKERVGTGRA
jgi:uncharacterized membrane protein HdeD (DUF308 family)